MPICCAGWDSLSKPPLARRYTGRTIEIRNRGLRESIACGISGETLLDHHILSSRKHGRRRLWTDCPACHPYLVDFTLVSSVPFNLSSCATHDRSNDLSLSCHGEARRRRDGCRL